MKLPICLLLLILSNNLCSDVLRCQTTIITPGMSLDSVKAVCGEPSEESEKKDYFICNSATPSVNKNCEKFQLQTLVYKFPSRYNIEFKNDKVFRVDSQIYP